VMTSSLSRNRTYRLRGGESVSRTRDPRPCRRPDSSRSGGIQGRRRTWRGGQRCRSETRVPHAPRSAFPPSSRRLVSTELPGVRHRCVMGMVIMRGHRGSLRSRWRIVRTSSHWKFKHHLRA
jgi:hypothetical protein